MSNTTRRSVATAGRGFTLVERLVVLAIIALLCAMLLQVRDVALLGQGMGKAQDNCSLPSFREPNDTGALVWASDYLNPDRPKADLYVPAIQPGQRFRAVTGVLEQYTNLGDGFDYYQLLTPPSMRRGRRPMSTVTESSMSMISIDLTEPPGRDEMIRWEGVRK